MSMLRTYLSSDDNSHGRAGKVKTKQTNNV